MYDTRGNRKIFSFEIFLGSESRKITLLNHKIILETYENIPHASFALKDNPKLTPSSTMNFKTEQSDGTVFKICTIGDDILRKKTKFVTIFDKNLHALVGDMIATMYACDGIGLAAPQIGISLKIAVIDVSLCPSESETCELDGKDIQDITTIMPLHLINPEIIHYSSETCGQREGCLSIPEFHGHVRRPAEVVFRFVDRQNISHTLTCSGILARCAQHEIDHLNGKLYTDLMSPKDKRRLAKYLAMRSQMQLSKCDNGDIGAADDFKG
ncbi:MAG: peptide deformylase [Puniceicoccales bacterium]|nr:peptide deformylase [Puniceicoccales bacterium]